MDHTHNIKDWDQYHGCVSEPETFSLIHVYFFVSASPSKHLVRTRQPQAILERPHRKGRHGQAEVGTGVQGILGLGRFIYELAGKGDDSFIITDPVDSAPDRREMLTILSLFSEHFFFYNSSQTQKSLSMERQRVPWARS